MTRLNIKSKPFVTQQKWQSQESSFCGKQDLKKCPTFSEISNRIYLFHDPGRKAIFRQIFTIYSRQRIFSHKYDSEGCIFILTMHFRLMSLGIKDSSSQQLNDPILKVMI